MDVEFEGAHMIWDGVLCCTADDPEAYYAADARRVLELFVLAAEQGLELKADTLLAWRRRPPCLWRGGGCICGGAGHPPCGTHRCAPRWNWTPLCRS